jgi:hypothetical protein
VGGFYGSILLRTEDAAGVRVVLENLAKENDSKFLLGPALSGWISVFPSEHGQDDSVSAELSRQLQVDVLHLLVHDDDVFAYFFYRAGNRADGYNSCPDYFGETSDEEKERQRGKPELFAKDKTAEVKVLLAAGKDQFPFEHDRLRGFAAVLGLPNAVGSYEYLRDGEREEIVGWKHFLHIPDLTAEKKEKRAAKARIKTELKRFQKEGVLLIELRQPWPKTQMMMGAVAWCCGPTSNGFLLCWTRHWPRDNAVALLNFDPGSTSAPTETGITLDRSPFALKVSPGGEWLAVGYASGNWKAQIWNLADKNLEFEIRHSSAVQALEFSRDEKLLISRSPHEAIITSLETRETVATFRVMAGGTAMALHPDNSFLAMTEMDKLAVVDLQTRAMHKMLSVCKGVEVHDVFPKEISEDMIRAALGDESFKNANSSKALDILASWTAGHRTQTFQTKETPGRLAFNDNGKLLFCATNKGLLVFDWEALLAQQDETPPPQFSIDSGNEKEYGGHVYGLALDVRRKRVLFCGLEGKVRFLDTQTGRTGTLLDIPGHPAVLGIELSKDHSTICCHCLSREENREPVSWLQIWNYRALSENAG